MNIENVNKIKKLALIALASDDTLMESLVLKGGNAIDLGYRHNSSSLSRASYDLDYSLENGDFQEDEVTISNRIKAALEQTYLENGFVVIDYKFLNKPKKIREELADFWGGYKVEFKVIGIDLFNKLKGNKNQMSSNSISLNPSNSPVFEIEFSKFEYIGQKRPVHIDGYKIYIYTAEMIVFEKVRALCQQTDLYKEVIPGFIPRARARDFYDIHLIMEMNSIDPTLAENIQLISNIFEAKRVPTTYIKGIRNNKALHSDNWEQVKVTISNEERSRIQNFDYYFDYVLNNFEPLIFP